MTSNNKVQMEVAFNTVVGYIEADNEGDMNEDTYALIASLQDYQEKAMEEEADRGEGEKYEVE